MAVTGTTIANDVRRTLQDEETGALRNADTDILAWINDGQRALCKLRPEESTARKDITLVPGADQSLGTDVLVLLDVIQNVPGSGQGSPNTMRLVDRKILDSFQSNWRNETVSHAVVNWMYDPKEPQRLTVYPPAAGVGGHKIVALCAIPPTDLASLTEELAVNDLYAPALMNYCLSRFYAQDTEDEANKVAAAGYMELFVKGVAG